MLKVDQDDPSSLTGYRERIGGTISDWKRVTAQDAGKNEWPVKTPKESSTGDKKRKRDDKKRSQKKEMSEIKTKPIATWSGDRS